jgi:ribulose-bisphosphate carboxylase large chain
MDRLSVAYHLDVEAALAEERAAAVAVEQTVEVPRAVVRDAFFEKQVMGSVERLERLEDGGYRAELSYPVEATALEPAQFLNVLFGNSSLHDDVRLLDFEPPASLCQALGGPRHGLAGLREVLGAAERPLSCTAIKPMGLSTEVLAELCGTFARAGIDVIKDDHGLADQVWSRFEERVPACMRAVREAADATGHHAVYAPNLIGTPERVLEKLRIAEAEGARAVLVSPMLLGLPFFWELRQRARIPLLAHPAFAGAPRMAAPALFGKLFRLFGADAVIYVSFGSRFRQSREVCGELAANLRQPWGGVAPALPVPAGGIRVESVPEVVGFYGRDVMLLVGGNLQIEAGALLERSRAFALAVREAGTPGKAERSR